MPELKEVFEMVTKQTEPDVGAWRDQERKQRRTSRYRKIGAYAVAAALIGIAAIVAVNSLPDRGSTEKVGDDPTVPVPLDRAATSSTSKPERRGRCRTASPRGSSTPCRPIARWSRRTRAVPGTIPRGS